MFARTDLRLKNIRNEFNSMQTEKSFNIGFRICDRIDSLFPFGQAALSNQKSHSLGNPVRIFWDKAL
jgi:hypothetical protein